MKGFLFAIAVIVIFAHATFAFEMDAADQTFVVSSGGSNEIKISVNSATDDKITLDLIDETPWMTLNTSQLDIKKGQSMETLLYVSPYSTTSPGVYKVTVAGESLITNEKKLKDIFISVTRGEGVEVEKIEVLLGGLKYDKHFGKTRNADGFELTLQFNCLPLPSTPDDDQRHAGRAHEQHQTFRVKLTGGEPRIGRERCDDRHLENCHRDQEPLWQRRCQIALAFEQRALKGQAWQIDGRTEQSSAAASIHLPCHPNGDEQTGDADQPEIRQKPDHSKPRRPADSGG